MHQKKLVELNSCYFSPYISQVVNFVNPNVENAPQIGMHELKEIQVGLWEQNESGYAGL